MLLYPIPKVELSQNVSEFVNATCNVCGMEGQMDVEGGAPIRQTIVCPYCGSTNRERQIANVLLNSLRIGGMKLPCLATARWEEERVIFQEEEGNSLYEVLYLCKGYRSGDIEDFSGPLYDIVVSCDTLSREADPYREFDNIFRSLNSGGSFVFTVPFNHVAYLDDIHPGASVFSLEMTIKLAKMGFVVYMHRLWGSGGATTEGIYGPDAIVFEAFKP